MTVFSRLSSDERAELWSCLALRHGKGIGPTRAKLLVQSCGTAYAAVQACLQNPLAWQERAGIPARICHDFSAQQWRGKALDEWQALQHAPCGILLWNSPDYPALLRELSDPPLVLYYRGDVRLVHNPTVSVVGSRSCTKEGMAVAAFFARALSVAGVTVISGMAKGIDRVAHVAGLEGCGKSIAVLGTGVDVVYPPCNADLAGALEKQGLILSEFAPGTPAAPAHFPIRNRLISGLSRGVLVVEAAGRSGSLITARLALEQGREVFAVPGHTMAPGSAGCRELIRRGAKAVFHADDILVELASLLTQDARAALQKSRSREKKAHPAARDRRRDPYLEEQNEATLVLPEGALPWQAQAEGASVPKGKEKQSVSGAASCAAAEGQTSFAMATLTPEERRVTDALADELHIDALSRMLELDVAQLSRVLTMLEVRGVVRRAPGMFYSLVAGGVRNA